jgi:hypothetical protein
MTNFKLLGVAAILSTVIATPVFAQAAISEPGAFQAMYPDRDVLNGGAPTPASRMGSERPGGAASVYGATNAYAGTGRPAARTGGTRYGRAWAN